MEDESFCYLHMQSACYFFTEESTNFPYMKKGWENNYMYVSVALSVVFQM